MSVAQWPFPFKIFNLFTLALSGTILSWFESYLTGRIVQDLWMLWSCCLHSTLHASVLFLKSFADVTQLPQSLLLITHEPLSQPCKNASLMCRPGWHKTNWNWMMTRERSQTEPFSQTLSPCLSVLTVLTFLQQSVLTTLVWWFPITCLLTNTCHRSP